MNIGAAIWLLLVIAAISGGISAGFSLVAPPRDVPVYIKHPSTTPDMLKGRVILVARSQR